MKRLLLPAWLILLLSATIPASVLRADDPPPDNTITNELDGWLRLDTCAPVGTGIVENLSQRMALSSRTADTSVFLLPLTTQLNPVTAPLTVGLTNCLPTVSNDLIAETVRALDCDWRQCYLFVRNQIHFKPYKCIMRGPERTLLDRQGNDADQAFLLLAMLRACGYTNVSDATVMYLPPPDLSTGAGGFSVPLGGTDSGYDAAGWLGLPSSSVNDTFARVNLVLTWAQLPVYNAIQSSVSTSRLLVEHFWVRLTISGVSYDLDPSFKPCHATPSRGSLLSDMGYSRDTFLTAAGGTTGGTGDKYSVKNLATTNLVAELCRLSTNLATAWQAAGTNAPASVFVGGREIVVQDTATDSSTFHGVANGTPVDFLAQTDAYKNALRSQIGLVHGCLTNVMWMDEIAARHLWLSYTNVANYTYPKAILHVDDTIIGTEALGYTDSSSVNVPISVSYPCYRPYIGTVNFYHNYQSIIRSPSYVFAIPFCVGDPRHNGMRVRALRELERLRAAGRPETDIALRSRVLQVAGQYYVEQTSLMNELNSRLAGTGRFFFFQAGVVGQKSAPFYDFANCVYCATNVPTQIDAGVIFASTLEHGVWDQLNGTNKPTVSTVRCMDLANAAGQSIYLATSSNWNTVRSKLTNYVTAQLDYCGQNVTSGHWELLHENGHTVLNAWTGFGFIDCYPTANGDTTGMIISQALNGGNGTVVGSTFSSYVADWLNNNITASAAVAPELSPDPVDLCSGAATMDHTDLALAGPCPIALSRHYDARQRHVDGAFGFGWSHGWDQRVVTHADPDARFGLSTTPSCVPSVVACAVMKDLFAADINAANVAIGCLVAKWWSDQLTGGAASVRGDGRTLVFERMPDGTYTPAPGVTAKLASSNAASFTLQERLGNTTTYGVSGMVTRIQDPSGNAVSAYYHNAYNDYLVTISNSFGQKLTYNWTWNNSTGHVTSVQDSANRTVSYRYSTSGCLTGVTDAAGYIWNYAYDSDNNLVSETDPTGVVTVRNTYNTFGQVTNQVAASGGISRFAFADGVSAWQLDALGGRTWNAFDPDGRLLSRVTPDNLTNAFFYDTQGQMVSNVDAIGRVTLRAYGISNNLLSVTEAANTPNVRSTEFGYDSQFHLVSVTNPLGRVTRMAYDTCHRLASKTAPDWTMVTNVYDSHGLLFSTRVLDAAGRECQATTSTYDSRGFATNVTATDAGSVQFGYDNAGNLTTSVDALNHTTRMFYDARGLLTNTLDAKGGNALRTYTSAGRLASSSDPLSRTNSQSWTASGQPAATRFPDGGIATNEYDIADRLSATKDPRGNRIQLALDSMGRTTSRWTSVWTEHTWYDPVGCATTTLDVVNGRTDIAYDWLDRPYAITDPMHHTWTNYYNTMGTLTGILDPKNRTTSYGLDIMDRRTSITYPSPRTEGFGFDALGRMTTFTNSEQHVYRLAYDAQSRLVAATNAANEQVFRNFYDVCGNLTNRLDGASRPVRSQYDILNRCTNTVYSDGSSESFAFDAVGNLLTAKNATTSNTFAYDVVNRLAVSTSRVAGVAFAFTYLRDLGGNITNLVYPSSKPVCYFYDADGRLTNVTDWASHSWRFTRDAAGQVTALTYQNNVSGAWQYDASHAVTVWSYSGAGSTLPGRTINRDAMGLKIREEVTGPQPQPFVNRRAVNSFNTADRLTNAVVTLGTNIFNEAYRYDGCGALTNIARSIGTNDLYTYDLVGRMTNASATNLALSIVYDALGNRVRTTVNGTNHLWAVDHSDPLKRPLMETDTNGVPVRYYIWGAGRLLAVIDADGITTRFAHCDDMGNVVALTSTDGAVVFTANYGPYGEPWGTTGTNDTPFGWLGGHGVFHADGSSLYLTRHRAYDTTLKRFLSPDPMGIGGGVNLYAYASGNPLAYIDPLGLCGQSAGLGAELHFMSQGLSEMGTFYGGMAQGIGQTAQGLASGLGSLVTDPVGTINTTVSKIQNLPNTFPAAVEAMQNDTRAAGQFYGSVVASTWLGTGTGKVLGELGVAETTMDPAAVRFSQSSISPSFSTGGTIQDLATGLRNGTVNAADIPPIRLVEQNGNLFTLDNRRLWSFQQAEMPIPYRMATPQEAAGEAWKFTTQNGGTTIRVRGQ